MTDVKFWLDFPEVFMNTFELLHISNVWNGFIFANPLFGKSFVPAKIYTLKVIKNLKTPLCKEKRMIVPSKLQNTICLKKRK